MRLRPGHRFSYPTIYIYIYIYNIFSYPPKAACKRLDCAHSKFASSLIVHRSPSPICITEIERLTHDACGNPPLWRHSLLPTSTSPGSFLHRFSAWICPASSTSPAYPGPAAHFQPLPHFLSYARLLHRYLRYPKLLRIGRLFKILKTLNFWV